jgi:hypothetical protein
MHTELKKIIESASAWADMVFADTGEILPMWHAITSKDENIIIPAIIPDKDAQAEALRALFKEKDVVICVFITEAWTCGMTDAKTAKRAMAWMRAGKSLESFPDRIEIVVFSGEDAHGTINAHRRIIRGEGRPTLGPLEWFETGEVAGRFVGMLPRRREALQ